MKRSRILPLALLSVIIKTISSKSLNDVDDLSDLKDEKHGIKMGVLSSRCDDGKTSLEVDWYDNKINYTCYNPTDPILPNFKYQEKMTCHDLPDSYSPQHYCMDRTISYPDRIPTYGDHRPNWPKFGEYKFVPPQRWLHNVEHGAVIMLYHPCTHHELVDKLRKIVKGCIRKHIITPSTLLPESQPLSLVAWGCRLSMSYVNEKTVVNFIRQKGLKGPEGTYPKEGKYTHELLALAMPPKGSDMSDSVLCPSYV